MTYRAIGIMTGTSCDGVDACLMTTDGEKNIIRHDFKHCEFDENLRKDLQNLGITIRGLGYYDSQSPEHQDIEERYTQAVADFILQNFNVRQVDVIGFHGQTILHQPHEGVSIQIGNPTYLTQITGVPVVFHFRQADMSVGGQGAPLIPLYHKALIQLKNIQVPTVFTNIGGIANITYYDPQTDILMGCDTGLGNSLSDFLCSYYFKEAYDKDGIIAASGTISRTILAELLEHPYFKKSPPKSLDRNDFNINIFKDLSPADAIATAIAFSVEALFLADKFLPKDPALRIIAGGGMKNKTMMQMIKKKSACKVITADKIGLGNQAIEAECFAWLAVRSLRKLPLSHPAVTGAKAEVTGGVLYKGTTN